MAKKPQVKVTVRVKPYEIEYTCPECGEVTQYNTDSVPTKEQCHKCLAELEFDYNITPKYE